MKKFFKVGVFAAVVAAFVAVLPNAQPAQAIVGGTSATKQYGVASIWTPPADGAPVRHRCHVNVVSPYWGVAPAHCLGVVIVGVTEIRASGLDVEAPFSAQNPDGYKESVGVAAAYPHPGYVPDQGGAAAQNDVTLIRFTNPIQQTAPLQLADTSSPVGTNTKVAGWGWTCDSDTSRPNCGLPLRYSPVLKELGLKIVNSSECTYPHSAAQYFCIKASDNELAMACVGDSGAPLTRKSFDNNLVLTGMVMGDGDLGTGHPNFCTSNSAGGKGTGLIINLATYKQWIVDTMLANSGGNSASVPASMQSQTSRTASQL